jgi:hypothetical protein
MIFWTHFRGQILALIFDVFYRFLGSILEHQFLGQFLIILRGGGRRGEIYRKMSLFGPPKTDFCYIVVSTFFGPSGPPPVHPFWTRFLKKYSLFVGNGHFIGVVFGGPKVQSFCKKVQNFKKFRFWGPGPPRSIFDHFGPPGPPP